MKITVSWLKDFLETSASATDIAHTLSMIGLEVEHVENPADKLRDFKVAHILETAPHPDADRLQICKVDTGDQILQIVCGAPNARANLKVIFAPEGSCIPSNGLVLRKTRIRGVESSGMLCSAAELELGEDSNGIVELPEDASVGQPYVSFAGLDDPIFDINITPNRSDCLSVYGIARDLAAAGLGTLKHPTFPSVSAAEKSDITVSIDKATKAACPVFMGRIIKGVRNQPSPYWMQQRLKAIGLRPKTFLVDLTNYLQFAYGHPMHIFDLSKVQGNLHVRYAHADETLKALDDEEYTLDQETIVVADDAGVLSIAGILGGKSSGCDEQTTDIFIETAVFAPQNIARTGRKLNILTDSRYRFERGVDHALVDKCLNIATDMILQTCGGQAQDVVATGSLEQPTPVIHFKPESVKKLTGLDLSQEAIANILTNLGFTITNHTTPWSVTVPSWRKDCALAADLVEEVARIHGYDAIEILPPILHDQPQNLTHDTKQNIHHRWIWAARRLLAAHGYHEAMTWSFLKAEQAKAFGGGSPELKLVNPISADLTDMRPSLLPNLLSAAQRNFDKGYPNTALFEIGPQFHAQDSEGQKTVIAGIKTGLKQERHWQKSAAEVDLYIAKQAAQAVLESCGIKLNAVQVVADAPAYYHPGRSGKICLGPKNVLAYFGELHPQIIKRFKLKERAVGFEVFVTHIPQPRTLKPGPLKSSSLQPVNRDFAFIVKASLDVGVMISAIQKADKDLIQDIAVFDVYQGKGIEPGYKSVALNITLQPRLETLTEQDLSTISQKIVHNVEKYVGGHLRS